MISLLRHGEALKNLRDEHGGDGSSLSPEGQAQAKAVASTFASWRPRQPIVLSINKAQCVETARILAIELQAGDPEVLDFPTFSLGVLDGLSIEATRERFAAYAQILDRWRSGTAEAAELAAIPGTTSAETYFRLGKHFLSSLSERCVGADLFVVCTRSVLVCFGNIVLGNSPAPGGNYREIVWPNCGVVTLRCDSESNLPVEPSKSNVARFV